jgi:membrane-associated phospholipid phosphatase
MGRATKLGGAYVSRLRLAGIALIILLAALNISVSAGFTQGFDVVSFRAVNSWSFSPLMDEAMIVLSLYGRELVWGGVLTALFFLGGKRGKEAAITMGIVFLILTGLGYGWKALDMRARPYDVLDGVRLLIGKESDYGFPSGHTLIVSGGVVVAWLYLRRGYAIILTAEASLVAFARIYVGVHFPTDVAGGVLLGAGCALIACSYPKLTESIYERLPNQLMA